MYKRSLLNVLCIIFVPYQLRAEYRLGLHFLSRSMIEEKTLPNVHIVWTLLSVNEQLSVTTRLDVILQWLKTIFNRRSSSDHLKLDGLCRFVSHLPLKHVTQKIDSAFQLTTTRPKSTALS